MAINFQEELKKLRQSAENYVAEKPEVAIQNPYNLTFTEAAATLRGRGFVQPDNASDEEFVIGYAFSTPERIGKLEFLGSDATKDIPLSVRAMLPSDSRHAWNPSLGEQLKYDVGYRLESVMSIMPSQVIEGFANIYESIGEMVLSPVNINYSKLGEGVSDIFWGKAGGFDKVNEVLRRGFDSSKKSNIKFPSADPIRDFYATHANNVIEDG